jgi:hypothetical protein
MSIMRHSRLFAVGIATVAVLVALSGLSGSSLAQTQPAAQPPPATPVAPALTALPPVLKCNPDALPDSFVGKLANKILKDDEISVSDQDRSKILSSDLPCQEVARPNGIMNPKGIEAAGLENLQRNFDFYSWRTFVALNSPADGKTTIDRSKPDTPTRWEDMANFKQLLDVMLPVNTPPAKWPTDRKDMAAERERLIPEECRALHKEMPERLVVKMIEESFNEPFKTGPLIDQQGRYAIFDILMNRQMFEYIMKHDLNTKAGQMSAANSGLAVDFLPGQNATAQLGAFMLKVSYKILGADEPRPDTFHQIKALVLMPPGDPKAKRPCLPQTLGLIGFHAVHKTASRPQWIWTSFEHKKNVPDKDEVAANTLEAPYNFFTIGCKGDCPAPNATPPRPWDPDPVLQLRFRKDNSFKSQIVRETPLTIAAKNMNAFFHKMLQGTVWTNYMLLSTQWPSAFGCTSLHSQSFDAPAPKTDFIKQPDMTCSPAPTFFANSTLETYSQGDIPQASSSCIGCHGNAVSFQTRPSNPKPGEVHLNQSDFTFMLEKAQ